jgi:hypothetical protein
MTEERDKKAKKPRLNLTTSQVAASALAACCSSIVASYLGVAGTVIGAAVGSVVATTGAAIYGHLFRTGGDKIKQTLLVNGQEVEVEVDRDDPVNEATIPAGRFYGAQANAATQTADLWHPKTPTGETQVITEESEEPGRTKADASPISSRIVRIKQIKKYRRPMGIAAAIIAVFCVSIVVGVIAGAPVRSAGSNSSPATVTTTTTVTDTAHTQGQSGNGSSASSSSSASPNPGGTSSATAPSSGSATSSSSAGSTASPTASPSAGSTSTGQALSGATSTGSPTS